MLRGNKVQNSFCQSIPCIIRPTLQMKKPLLWLNTQYKEEARLDDIKLPQSVITQKLKFLVNRNDFIKELSNFSLHSIQSQYYQKSLYDISHFIDYSQQSNQIHMNEQEASMSGLKLFQVFSPEQIQLLKFHFNQPQSITSISFIDGAINLIKNVHSFQDSLFVNFASNLFELFYEPQNNKKSKQQDEKFKELFQEFGIVLYKFDYLSQSQPLNIAKIIGQLYDLMITNSIKLNDFTHYRKTANNFIQKYYGIQSHKMIQPNIVDYKNILYTIFLSEIRPEALIQDAVNRFANSGIQSGSISSNIDIMSMMLLHGVPCTENFLNKLKNSKRQRLTIGQLYVLLKCYELAKVPLYEFSQTLFLDVVSFISHDKQLQDGNSVLMLARICNELFSSSFITSKVAQERRNDKILNFLERNVQRHIDLLNFNHLLFISNVFNKHLKQPNFLISLLHEKLSEIKINESSLSLYNDFLEITYEFFKEQYTHIKQHVFDFGLAPSQEYQAVTKTFVENLIQFQFTSILATNILKVVSLSCFQFEKSIILKLISKPSLFSNDVNLLTKVMKLYDIPINQEILNIIMNGNKDDQIMTIESIYYVCQMNSLTSEQQAQLKQFAQDIIYASLAENEQYLVEQRQIDDFTHTYSLQINHQSFESVQYFPEIINTLQITFETEQIAILNKLYERTCVLWNSDILVKNLILIDKMNILNYQIYIKSSENLLSCFDLVKDGTEVLPSGLLADKKVQMSLLKAFLQQIRNSTHQFQESLKILGYLAYMNIDQFNNEDVMLFCKALGNTKDVYFSDLQVYLENYLTQNQLPNESNIIQFSSFFPFIHLKVRQLLKENFENNKIEKLSLELLIASQNQQVGIHQIDQLFEQLDNQEKQKFIKPILQNLIQTWDLKCSIDTIIRFASQCYEEQDSEFKFIYQALEFLNRSKSSISIKMAQDETYFQLHFNQKIVDSEFETKVQELFNGVDLKGLNFKTTKENVNYFPSITTEMNYNQLPKYKVSMVKKQPKAKEEMSEGRDQLSYFLKTHINNLSMQPQYKFIDSFIYLMILNGLEGKLYKKNSNDQERQEIFGILSEYANQYGRFRKQVQIFQWH
ncbi:unnamed protein product (macronuclear) [Paramecium tetraurelia]|uniref:Uncharacterized protein n=1 Tax=Paramecium tetraurelia TaxID=5888 RepID=A0BMV9_PARTE|nr:uncharacterized protein GSPATT00030513001 [Paramecium tetraurelia]CAK59876.1 unnamed protein product [Paramecium tetraurelia]|eukprot:XP_001427274.1 hypothetical protein (macronuclear) [Paramecium tetraurelia strain d4-2]